MPRDREEDEPRVNILLLLLLLLLKYTFHKSYIMLIIVVFCAFIHKKYKRYA